MSERTNISWADSTASPWFGCSMKSPGCAHCYAHGLMRTRFEPLVREAYRLAGIAEWRMCDTWGDKAPRVLSKSFWRDVRGWNSKPLVCDNCQKTESAVNRSASPICGRCGGTMHRRKIFPSLMDWLDNMPAGIIDQNGKWLDPQQVMAEMLTAIRDTPNLIWMLLTKSPERFFEIVGEFDMPYEGPLEAWVSSWVRDKNPPENVWIGTTVEDQTRADERIPHLLKIPARIRFLSCEPLLGPIDLWGARYRNKGGYTGEVTSWGGVDLVIIGGEGGPGASPCNVDWIRSLKDQCQAARVCAFVKQLGSNVCGDRWKRGEREFHNFGINDWSFIRHPKGGDPSEWPEDLRVQEMPQ